MEEKEEKEEEEEEEEWSGGHNKPVPAANPSRPLLLPEGTSPHFVFQQIFFYHIAATFSYLRLATFVVSREESL